jgi:hypothetical protein
MDLKHDLPSCFAESLTYSFGYGAKRLIGTLFLARWKNLFRLLMQTSFMTYFLLKKLSNIISLLLALLSQRVDQLHSYSLLSPATPARLGYLYRSLVEKLYTLSSHLYCPRCMTSRLYSMRKIPLRQVHFSSLST